jgi:23S rRNA (cytidine1920-2'-O)/16S rRNA (cytidine1409-2'-O)-methyltransferase
LGSKGKLRLDQRLVRDGLVSDLRQAQALIMAGQVLVGEQRADKAGLFVSDSVAIRVKGLSRFVSRGGEKLWGAIEDLALAELFPAAVVLDCGASTGGFTDCALQLGASRVYALDVGFNQLSWKLRQDLRVVVMEKTDVRDLTSVIDPHLKIVLADISFNSLDRLLPALSRVAPETGVDFILLVKPQFELQAEEVPEGGVVMDASSRQKALLLVIQAMQREGLKVLHHVDSRLAGRDGNLEIFVHARR